MELLLLVEEELGIELVVALLDEDAAPDKEEAGLDAGVVMPSGARLAPVELAPPLPPLPREEAGALVEDELAGAMLDEAAVPDEDVVPDEEEAGLDVGVVIQSGEGAGAGLSHHISRPTHTAAKHTRAMIKIMRLPETVLPLLFM